MVKMTWYSDDETAAGPGAADEYDNEDNKETDADLTGITKNIKDKLI